LGCVPRADRTLSADNDERRTRFSLALNAEIRRLRGLNEDVPRTGVKELAKALAAVDGRSSASAVLDVIALPGQWDHHTRLEAAKRLLMAGVVLPTATAFALLDSALERTEKWMQDSDRYLLCGILALCLFVDDPEAGIAKIRDVLGQRRFRGHELRQLISSLGESHFDNAINLLCDLASDPQTFEQCEEHFINAFAALDTPRTHELLLELIHPGTGGIVLTRRSHNENVLVAQLTDLARRRSDVATQLADLCGVDLPEFGRQVLSKIMARLGTPEALTANLKLIEDANHQRVPQGVWDQLHTAFVEQRPYGQDSNVYTQHPRRSNDLRVTLFRMASQDEKRRQSASILLGHIEEWRLEYGRPTGEPRHPDLASGQPWPPTDNAFSSSK
jgi:hypothetical protein